MPDAHKNFAYSTVATAPSPADTGTSLVVQTGDGAKFPTPPFNATVWPYGDQPLTTNAEIVRVTAISGDTMTIMRTQEGTTARLIGVNDQIAATITAKTLTDIESGVGARLQLAVVATSGSWVVPAGVTSILAEAWAGGGAGGGSADATSGGGAGGGSGGYAKRAISTMPGETLTATIGAGGSGAVNATGGNGGNTLLQRGTTTLLQANGGTGGPGAGPSSGTGGAGGTVGIGDFTVAGQQGGPAVARGDGNVNGGGSAPRGGSGGAPTGIPSSSSAASTAGNAGVTPGGGGSGSFTVSGPPGTAPSVAGGNGAPGLIVITYSGGP